VKLSPQITHRGLWPQTKKGRRGEGEKGRRWKKNYKLQKKRNQLMVSEMPF